MHPHALWTSSGWFTGSYIRSSNLKLTSDDLFGEFLPKIESFSKLKITFQHSHVVYPDDLTLSLLDIVYFRDRLFE